MTTLNIACGDAPMAEAVNVDFQATGDVVADVAHLPIRTGSVDDAHALDILEHIPHQRTHDVLAEWRRVLRPGGRLTVRVPNMGRLARLLLVQPQDTELIIRNIYGGHRWGPDGAWDAHHWGWTQDSLACELAEAGFTPHRPDGHSNMTMAATA